MVAAARATEVDSAIEALGFETEPRSIRRGSKGLAPLGAIQSGARGDPTIK
jgi:hypothetical protein